MQTETLETERLILRSPCASDLQPYTSYCLSDRSRYVGGPFDQIQAFDKLAAMIGHWQLRGFGRYVIVDRKNKQPLGHVGALQVLADTTPELTWTLWDSASENKGYAIEACRSYYAHAKDELKLGYMVARIMPANTASVRLALKLGGKLNTACPPPRWFPESVTYEFNKRCADQQHSAVWGGNG